MNSLDCQATRVPGDPDDPHSPSPGTGVSSPWRWRSARVRGARETGATGSVQRSTLANRLTVCLESTTQSTAQ